MGWVEGIFLAMRDYYDVVARAFTQGFDGHRVEVGGLSLLFT